MNLPPLYARTLDSNRSHYQEKLSAPEIKGAANPQMCHSDGLNLLYLDLRGLGRDRESEGGAPIFWGGEM